MKKASVLTVLICALLMTACGQAESAPDNQTALPPPTMQEERQAMHADTQMQTVLEEQSTKEQQTQPNPQQATATESTREAAAVQTTSLPDTALENPDPVATASPAAPQDIPSATVHAKTGYVEPEPEPTPEPDPAPVGTADRQAAMDAANAYAVTTYGVETDGSLTLGNSAYRFPASVPTDATQATLEAKARDMVDFTFRQLMMQAGVDTLADAGFRCNVCIMEDGGSLLIYVLYDG